MKINVSNVQMMNQLRAILKYIRDLCFNKVIVSLSEFDTHLHG